MVIAIHLTTPPPPSPHTHLHPLCRCCLCTIFCNDRFLSSALSLGLSLSHFVSSFFLFTLMSLSLSQNQSQSLSFYLSLSHTVTESPAGSPRYTVKCRHRGTTHTAGSWHRARHGAAIEAVGTGFHDSVSSHPSIPPSLSISSHYGGGCRPSICCYGAWK